MAEQHITAVTARVKRQDEQPATQRAYIKLYGFRSDAKRETVVSSLLTESAAITLAEELLVAVRHARKHNAEDRESGT